MMQKKMLRKSELSETPMLVASKPADRISDPYTYHYLGGVFILAWLLATANFWGSLAAWVLPILMVRFLRTQTRALGFVLGLTALLVPGIWMHQNKVPGGLGVAVVIVFFNMLAVMFMYMSDRILRNRFSWLLASLILPAFMTTWEYISALGNPFGTMLAPMNVHFGFKPFVQIVSWTGLWGLVFIPTWTATLVNAAWERKFNWTKTKLIYLVLILLTVAWGSLGTFRYYLSATSTAGVSVIAVTPDPTRANEISSSLVGFYRKPEKTGLAHIQRLFTENHEAIWKRINESIHPGTNLVVLTESAEYILAEQEPNFVLEAQTWAQTKHVFLQLSYTVFHQNDFFKGKRFLENLTLSIDDQGKIQNSHMKSVFLPGLEAISHRVGNGSMPVTETTLGNWSAILGWEGDFPAITLQAQHKALGILFILGDEWSGSLTEHARAQYFRGIELGCSVVRVFKHGILGVADSHGRIFQELNDLSSNKGMVLDVRVPSDHSVTLYSRYGNWLGDACLYTSMALLLIFLFKKYSLYQRWLRKPFGKMAAYFHIHVLR